MEIKVNHLHTLNSNPGGKIKRKQKPPRKGGLVQHHQLWSSGSPALFFHPLLALGVGGLEGWGVHLVGHRWKQLADPRGLLPTRSKPGQRSPPTKDAFLLLSEMKQRQQEGLFLMSIFKSLCKVDRAQGSLETHTDDNRLSLPDALQDRNGSAKSGLWLSLTSH